MQDPTPRLKVRASRVAMAVALALTAAVGHVAPASAWIGAPTNYQTHHWFIDQAVRLLGTDASWFDAAAAREAVDDPDTNNVHGTYHVYRDTGLRGGAVQRASEYYAAAVRLYKEKKYEEASFQIGLASHYYTDILQPYHSHYDGIGKTAEHANYEQMVMKVTNDPGDHPDWGVTGHTPGPISNIRSETIAAAAFSRASFAALHPRVAAAGTTFTAEIEKITKPLMRRAVNDLADIIYSVKRGVGVAPNVSTLTASVKWQYPAKSYPYQSVYVTARDAAGKPIEGLEVRITVPVPLGSTTTESRYTDPDGRATWNGPVAASPYFAKQTVTVRATTNGSTATTTTWWATTPVLADGHAGFVTRVDNTRPVVDQYVTVSSTARDTSGRPVAGLVVDWRWDVGGSDVITTGVTNASGVATSRYRVVPGTTFDLSRVYAHVISGSHNRYSSASFVRQPHPGTSEYRGWFTDVWDSKFRDNAVWLAQQGITTGCSSDRFCPEGLVTRGQMATFLARALDLPSTRTDYFDDDETSKHEASINRLAASGITMGCGTRRFCPDGRVTREQMASFLSRGLALPNTTRDYFRDDETSKHEASINRLAASGITSGCAADRFCPAGTVTRGQMSAFLNRGLTR